MLLPTQTDELDGLDVIAGTPLPTVKAAGLEFAIGHAPYTTQRYWLPLSPTVTPVSVKVVEVAPL